MQGVIVNNFHLSCIKTGSGPALSSKEQFRGRTLSAPLSGAAFQTPFSHRAIFRTHDASPPEGGSEMADIRIQRLAMF